MVEYSSIFKKHILTLNTIFFNLTIKFKFVYYAELR